MSRTEDDLRPSLLLHILNFPFSITATPLSFVPIHKRSRLSTYRHFTLVIPVVDAMRSKFTPSYLTRPL